MLSSGLTLYNTDLFTTTSHVTTWIRTDQNSLQYTHFWIILVCCIVITSTANQLRNEDASANVATWGKTQDWSTAFVFCKRWIEWYVNNSYGWCRNTIGSVAAFSCPFIKCLLLLGIWMKKSVFYRCCLHSASWYFTAKWLLSQNLTIPIFTALYFNSLQMPAHSVWPSPMLVIMHFRRPHAGRVPAFICWSTAAASGIGNLI